MTGYNHKRIMKLMSEQIHSSSLYKDPSFLQGMARTIDLFGVLNRYNQYNTTLHPDYEALKRDWEVIGLDLYDSIEAFRKEERTKESKE